jgi:hypothetical protein
MTPCCPNGHDEGRRASGRQLMWVGSVPASSSKTSCRCCIAVIRSHVYGVTLANKKQALVVLADAV